MVAYVLDENLRHVRTHPFVAGGIRRHTAVRHRARSLFVAYSAWAEMICFIHLNWRFPVHVFDLHTAYLAATNVLLPYDPDEVRNRPRKRLSDACRAYGIEGWEKINKEEIAEALAKIGGASTAAKSFSIIAKKMLQETATATGAVDGQPDYQPPSSRVLHWSN